jgi:hypothetical protein
MTLIPTFTAAKSLQVPLGRLRCHLLQERETGMTKAGFQEVNPVLPVRDVEKASSTPAQLRN